MVAPLVAQGRGRLGRVASTIRRQQFITKTELGPQTVQAITEGELEQERLEAQTQSRVALQAKVQRENIEAQERIASQQAVEARKLRQQEKVSDVEKAIGFVIKIFST